MRISLLAMTMLALLLPSAASAHPPFPSPGVKAPNTQNPALSGVGFDQKLGDAVPSDLPFTDETGASVRLGDYFSLPVVLVLAYYRCPNLCTLTLDGLFKALALLPFRAGETFNVVVASIDPTDGPALASRKKREYSLRYGAHGQAPGLRFLTGDAVSLARAVGFRYARDERTGQYAHPSGAVVLTPGGRISRYLFGIDYAEKDLRLALVESAERRIGSPVDRFLLFCFHYDPVQGGYGLAVTRLLQAGGLLTVAALGLLIGIMLRREGRA